LLNRSVDRWFSQPTSELREDSTRVVLELAHYAASNARLEAEAIAASGALDRDVAAANAEIHSRRITLEGGYVAVFGPDKQGVLGYQLPDGNSKRSLLPWLDDGNAESVPLQGPVYSDLLTVAQRSDEPILIVDGGQQKREFASGIAVTPGGRLVVVGLPMPQGLSETANQIRVGASEYWTLFRSRNSIRTTYFFMLLLITTLVFFSSMWLALFLSKQITRPVEALADAMDEIAAGKLDKRVAVESSGEMDDGRPDARLQSHGAGSGDKPSHG
jgi:two-component system nitrogen regulation sensor histidine kinase NtrY